MPGIVVSVGQCGFDDMRIGQVVRAACDATLESAYDGAEAAALLAKKDVGLVLVNRLFDGTGESGVEFIRAQRAAGLATPMMLVSDYADAQESAVKVGALPGFGKSQLNEGAVGALLRAALEAGGVS